MEAQERRKSTIEIYEDEIKQILSECDYKALEALADFLREKRTSSVFERTAEKLEEMTNKMLDLGSEAVKIYDEMYDRFIENKLTYDFIEKNKNEFIKFNKLINELNDLSLKATDEYSSKIKPIMEKMEHEFNEYLFNRKDVEIGIGGYTRILNELFNTLHKKGIDYMKKRFGNFTFPLIWRNVLDQTYYFKLPNLEVLAKSGLVISKDRYRVIEYDINKIATIGWILNKYGSLDNIQKSAEDIINSGIADKVVALKEKATKISSFEEYAVVEKERKELSEKLEDVSFSLGKVISFFPENRRASIYKIFNELEKIVNSIHEVSSILIEKKNELTKQHFISLVPQKFRKKVETLIEKDRWSVVDKYFIINPSKTVSIVITPNNIPPEGIFSNILKNAKYMDYTTTSIMVKLERESSLDNKNAQKFLERLEELVKKPGVKVTRFEKNSDEFRFEGYIPIEYYRKYMYAEFASVKNDEGENNYMVENIYQTIRLFSKPKRIGTYNGVLVMDYNDFKVLVAPVVT